MALVHLFDFDGQKIAFNGESYQVAVLDDAGFSDLSGCQAGKEPEPSGLDGELQRFLTPPQQPSTAHDPFKQTGQPTLAMLCLLVTSRCNLKCDYCFNHQGSYSFLPAQDMDERTAMNAVRFLLKHCGASATISFFGGEPILMFPFVRKIVEFAEAQANGKLIVNFSIATNGTLITDEIARFLKSHGFAIVYSMDGGDEFHDYHRKFPGGAGSFQQTLQGAQKILAAYDSQDKIVFRGTYTCQNKEFDSAYVQLTRSGFKNISIEPAVGSSGDPHTIQAPDLSEVAVRYRQLARDYWTTHRRQSDASFFHFTNLIRNLANRQKQDTPCGAANGYIAVAPNGDIYPCHRIVDPAYKLGNVNDLSPDQPLNSPWQAQFHHATLDHRPGCQECWAKWLCGGSCYARNIEDQKDILDPHPVDCALMKIRAEAAIWIYVQQELLAENLTPDTLFQDHHIRVFEPRQLLAQSSTQRDCGKLCEIIGCQVSCQSSCTSSCTGNCVTSCEPFY